MRSKTSTLGIETLNRNYDQDLKKYFCNIRIWKVLLNESFEEFYSSFLGKNNEFDYKLFQNTIEYINTLLENNSMNIRYKSIEDYIWVYSSSVKEILSDEDLEANSMMKLKDDLIILSSEIFKKWWEAENKESIKKRIKAFIGLEKFKIENIKLDYANDKIDLTINTFTKKFFELI